MTGTLLRVSAPRPPPPAPRPIPPLVPRGPLDAPRGPRVRTAPCPRTRFGDDGPGGRPGPRLNGGLNPAKGVEVSIAAEEVTWTSLGGVRCLAVDMGN